MFSLIIVDDEPFLINSFEKMIDLESIGFSISATFTSSPKALEYIKANHVDVVLTDIAMPEISGLDIARYCYTNSPSTKIILLSAYSDFEYAQEGIACKVFSYITKPATKSTIVKTFSKLYYELSAVQQSLVFMGKDNRDTLRKCFVDLVSEASPNIDKISTHLREAGMQIDINKARFAIFTIIINDFQSYFKTKWQHGKERLIFAIEQLVNAEHSCAYSVLTFFFDNGFDMFLISKLNTMCDTFDKFAADYTDSLHCVFLEYLNMDIEVSDKIITDSIEEFVEYSASHQGKKQTANSRNNQMILDKAREFIEQNYAENVTLDEIAANAGFHPVYFSTLFKKHFGINFLDYLTNIRLEKAKSLLIDSDVKITLIPPMIGLFDLPHFSKKFKAYTGYSPSEYRNKYRKL